MDISLIETLRFEPGTGFIRLERHLARLARSADALGLQGATGARAALAQAAPLAGEAEAASPLRVRLELFRDGGIEVRTAPFAPLAEGTVWTVKVAQTRLRSDDPLLRHKTSHRAAYDAARGEFAPDAADEVILLNERGEVCEGTITSVFLDDGSGVLKTPPLSAGLLAGILRQELIEAGWAAELPLHLDDLRGHRLLVGNSLRGLIPARLA